MPEYLGIYPIQISDLVIQPNTHESSEDMAELFAKILQVVRLR